MIENYERLKKIIVEHDFDYYQELLDYCKENNRDLYIFMNMNAQKVRNVLAYYRTYKDEVVKNPRNFIYSIKRKNALKKC